MADDQMAPPSSGGKSLEVLNTSEKAQGSLEYILMVAAAVFFLVFAALLVWNFISSSQAAAGNQLQAYRQRLNAS